MLLAYRKGVVERRSITDGKPLGSTNVEQPLATGPVEFLQRYNSIKQRVAAQLEQSKKERR